ncbi:MFS transporter [Ornithinibacillus contaminans]|uniref:MFS transporter n=1 Tax=Ornithinibacillus contaminans TaxID=694055 RepID=UPI00064D8BF8|nr:MFS transporter [Ornithinibacillus contaminans]
MRESTVEKLYIFIIMFFISLIMRLQVPIFTPFAAILGASSILIGIILSVTSFTNLIGNLLSGPLIDRLGKKVFITIPIFTSGIIFFAHGLASNAVDLLLLHALNGFALAFLIPAVLALLSGYATNSHQQGKNIAMNGILTTFASIIGPLIGGNLVELIGYQYTYYVIGTAMILTGVFATQYLREHQEIMKHSKQKNVNLLNLITIPKLAVIYLVGFAVMYNHGVIIYEIPYLTVEKGLSTAATGQLFSFMGIGTFLTLSLFFINRFDPMKRLMIGLFGMSISIFILVALPNIALPIPLFTIGLFSGLIMPAMATAITENVTNDAYGKAFGVMSAVYSLGIIASSFITGISRDFISPYFIAFIIGMSVLTVLGLVKLRAPIQAQAT